VLQRLKTPAPASHADGCQCLGSETSEVQELPPLSKLRKGEAMSTSTWEPLTMLPPSAMSETASDERCGCGCGCGTSLTQLACPQDTADHKKVQPTRS
jgi:hypothetical protein